MQPPLPPRPRVHISAILGAAHDVFFEVPYNDQARLRGCTEGPHRPILRNEILARQSQEQPPGIQTWGRNSCQQGLRNVTFTVVARLGGASVE